MIQEPFAFKIEELVKLASPDFEQNSGGTIVRDYYIKGLYKEPQNKILWIRSYE